MSPLNYKLEETLNMLQILQPWNFNLLFAHLVPLNPGLQIHVPSTGWQTPSFKHSHILLQTCPNLSSSQTY